MSQSGDDDTGTTSQKSARHTLDGTTWGFLAEAIALPTGLATAAFLSRQLQPDGYGLFALAVTLIIWIEATINSFLSSASIKFVSQADDWEPVGTAVVHLYVLTSLGCMLLIWVTAAPIAGVLDAPQLGQYLWLFALDLPLAGLANAHQRLLIGTGQYRSRALMRAVRRVARLVLIVILVELGLSIPGAIIGSMSATLCEFLVARWYIRPPFFRRSSFSWQPLIGYATPLLLSGLGLRIVKKIDLFALKGLAGTAADAGYYAAAQNLAVVPSLFSLAFTPLLLSSLNHSLEIGDTGSARRLGRDAQRVVFFLYPFAGMSAGAAWEVVRFIYGPDFMPAGLLLALLIFSGVNLLFISVATNLLVALDRPNWTIALIVPFVPAILVGHYVLIPSMGAPGAALVTTTGTTLAVGLSVAAIYVRWELLPPPTTVLRSIGITALAYGAARAWPTSGLLLVLKLLLIAGGIVVLFWLLGEVKDRDRTTIRSLLHTLFVREESASELSEREQS